MKFGIDEQGVIDEANNLEQENEKISARKDSIYQEQTQSKGGWRKKKRGKTKEEKEFPRSSVESETIWREVNLFLPEAIAIAVTAVAGATLMFLVRFMSITGLELIKEMLSDQAYIEVSGLVSNMNTMFLAIAALPFLVLIGFFMYRMFVFTPRKNRYMVARVKREGAISLSVEAVKDGEVAFARGMMDDKMKINNPRKHWLSNTGKPIIFLFEGDDCNADLNIMAGNVSNKARDTNTINENAIALGRRIERYIQEKKEGLLTPMNILLILILGAIGLVLFLVLKNPETTAQLMGTAPALMRF